MFDFDRVIERRGTHSAKWDNVARLSGIESPDAIPMWVADMDFAAPPGVTAALTAEVQRATHGYYADTGSWARALADWMKRRHSLHVEPGWVSPTPGIVSGLGLILQAVSEPGDEVALFPPVYHAFRRIIVANGRRILDVQLVEAEGRYTMDFDALRDKLTPRTKVVFLCSPHNPGGTVWSVEELRALAAFCAEHDLILVSDEIHCDLLFDGAKHTPTLTAAPEIADRLITCVAATKTFNLAGAHVGGCFTSNAALEEAPRRPNHGERSRLLQRLRHDRDRGGLAHRRSMARCLAAVSRCKPRSVRCANPGGGARRPLHASGLAPISPGSIFPRPVWRRKMSPPGWQSARAFLPAPARSSDRAARPGCVSISQRRARFSRKLLAGLTMPLPIFAGRSERSDVRTSQ